MPGARADRESLARCARPRVHGTAHGWDRLTRSSCIRKTILVLLVTHPAAGPAPVRAPPPAGPRECGLRSSSHIRERSRPAWGAAGTPPAFDDSQQEKANRWGDVQQKDRESWGQCATRSEAIAPGFGNAVAPGGNRKCNNSIPYGEAARGTTINHQ